MALDDKYVSTLQGIGLTSKQAILYLTALNEGALTVIQLSKFTDIKRTTVYPILKSLLDMGLMHVEIRGVKQYFAAESPNKLEQLLNLRKQLLQQITPNLTTLYLGKDTEENLIKYYPGVEGTKSIYDKILSGLKSDDYYYVISNQRKWYNIAPAYFDGFIHRRNKLNLDVKLLLQATDQAGLQHKADIQVRYLPVNKNLNINMVLTPNEIVFMQITSPVMAIVIENKNIISMNKVFFDLLWETSVTT